MKNEDILNGIQRIVDWYRNIDKAHEYPDDNEPVVAEALNNAISFLVEFLHDEEYYIGEDTMSFDGVSASNNEISVSMSHENRSITYRFNPDGSKEMMLFEDNRLVDRSEF